MADVFNNLEDLIESIKQEGWDLFWDEEDELESRGANERQLRKLGKALRERFEADYGINLDLVGGAFCKKGTNSSAVDSLCGALDVGTVKGLSLRPGNVSEENLDYDIPRRLVNSLAHGDAESKSLSLEGFDLGKLRENSHHG